jgi:hypothetical protein
MEVVAYRSVIGQPRQEELVEFMLGRMTEAELEGLSSRCAIELSPRRNAGWSNSPYTSVRLVPGGGPRNGLGAAGAYAGIERREVSGS